MDYKKRMTEYYPQVLRDCRDMQGIIGAEYPEFEFLGGSVEGLVNEDYLDTMTKERIEQWEKFLGISPAPGASLDERRAVITGKLRDPGKMNEDVIGQIVTDMTGGTAECSFDAGILIVEITPAANDGMDLYPDVDKELEMRIPAHIKLNVTRKLATWQKILDTEGSWADVKNHYASWRYVKTIVPKG